MKRIFFISGSVTPVKDAGGGNVVIYRHLSKLQANGIKIVYINANPSATRHTSFDQLNLVKKFWHPPLRKRFPWLTEIRFRSSIRQISKRYTITKDDILLSVLEDAYAYLTYLLAKEKQIPYYLFFHDDNVFNRYFLTSVTSAKHLDTVIRNCSHFFVVSDEMKSLLESKGRNNVTVLPPIPEGMKMTKDIGKVNFDQLSICAGGIFPEFHAPVLQLVEQAVINTSSRLVLIGPGSVLEDLVSSKEGQVIVKDRFTTLSSLFSFLIEEIDCLLVFYSFDQDLELRSIYSFPSKFVEYCHLGIPILILAPYDSALGRWAVKNQWLTYLSENDAARLSEMIGQLKDPDFWRKCREQCLHYSRTSFNPDRIQKEFTDTLQL